MNATDLLKYSTQGFLGPFSLLDAKEAGRIARLVRRRVLPRPSIVPGQPAAKHRHLDARSLFEICVHPGVLDLAAHLGDELMVWNSTLFDKEGEITGPMAYPWHRESYYWRIEPLVTMSFWVALERSHPGNGCMEFLPGSHKWDVPMTREPSDQYSSWFSEGRADERTFNDQDRIAVTMGPGECVAFSEHLLHRSLANKTGEHRLGFAFRIAPTHVRIGHPFPCVLIRGGNRAGNVVALPPAADPLPVAVHLAWRLLQALRGRLGFNAVARASG